MRTPSAWLQDYRSGRDRCIRLRQTPADSHLALEGHADHYLQRHNFPPYRARPIPRHDRVSDPRYTMVRHSKSCRPLITDLGCIDLAGTVSLCRTRISTATRQFTPRALYRGDGPVVRHALCLPRTEKVLDCRSTSSQQLQRLERDLDVVLWIGPPIACGSWQGTVTSTVGMVAHFMSREGARVASTLVSGWVLLSDGLSGGWG